MSVSEIAGLGLGGVVLAGIGGSWLWAAVTEARVEVLRVRGRRRARVAEAAAVDASLEVPAFAPERVRGAVDAVLALAEEVWAEGASASCRADVELIAGWAAAVAARLGGNARVLSGPRVEFLEVVNRPGELEDRVAVRVRLRLGGDRAGLGSRAMMIDQRWRFGREGDAWSLRSIDQRRLEPVILGRRLIAHPWSDDARLREQALVELGALDASGSTPRLDELIAPDLTGPRRLRELAQIDARFAPSLIEAVLVHLVEVWEAASSGSDEPLHGLCGEDAARELQRPLLGAPSLRFVIDGAVLDRWTALAVNTAAEHPRIEIDVSIRAVRYLVETSGGGLAAGSREIRHDLKPRWTLALFDTEHNPWRLLASSDPTVAIPGLAERRSSSGKEPQDPQTLLVRSRQLAHEIAGFAPNTNDTVTAAENPAGRPPPLRTRLVKLIRHWISS